MYKRLFEQEPGWEFMGEMMDCSDGLGVFSDENMQLGYWEQHYDGSVCCSPACIVSNSKLATGQAS